jgi:tetratricopeptide (TPR) repeat protein
MLFSVVTAASIFLFTLGAEPTSRMIETQASATKPEEPKPTLIESMSGYTIEQFIEAEMPEIRSIVECPECMLMKKVEVTREENMQMADLDILLGQFYANFLKLRSAQLEAEKAGYKKAVETSLKTILRYSKHEKYQDEILFKLGYVLRKAGQREEAHMFFLRLFRNVDVAFKYFIYAKLFLNESEKEMEVALAAYYTIERNAESPSLRSYAVYKQGLCHLGLGDFKGALEAFGSVVRMTQKKTGGSKAVNEALRQEAKKDIVKAYAHVGNADHAWRFMRRAGGDFAPKMLEALAERYAELGKAPESTNTYRKLITQNEKSPRICEWQHQILRNTLSSGTKRDQLQEVKRLGRAYDRVKKLESAEKELLEECTRSYHDTIKELVFSWHQEAEQTRTAAPYAISILKEFLDRFPDDKDSKELGLHYAKLKQATVLRKATEPPGRP